MQEFTLEMLQLLTLFGVLFVISFIVLSIVVIQKGYQLNNKYLRFNFSGVLTGLITLAVALGVFLVALIGMPNFVYISPIYPGDTVNLALTIFIVAAIVSLFSGMFMLYTKRGGL